MMNQAQKVVVSIAVGAALVVGAGALSQVFDNSTDGGWFMYSPNSTTMFSPQHGSIARGVAIWMAAIAIWLVFASRLFRSRAD